MGAVPPHVSLIGAGQVGRALARALGARGIAHCLLPLRRGLPSRAHATDLILICVRDGQIPLVVRELTGSRLASGAVVAHVSGLLGPSALAPLERHCRAVGQLHPFVSIRSIGHARDFVGVYFLGDGNKLALATLRRFVRLIGGQFVNGERIDRARYHLAAALLANGSAALLHVALQQLTQAGVRAGTGRKMLLELGHSVLHNAGRLGLEVALTGPVRRGDVGTIQQHLALLQGESPSTHALYRCLARTQLDIVRGLGELDTRTIRRLARLIRT